MNIPSALPLNEHRVERGTLTILLDYTFHWLGMNVCGSPPEKESLPLMPHPCPSRLWRDRVGGSNHHGEGGATATESDLKAKG